MLVRYSNKNPEKKKLLGRSYSVILIDFELESGITKVLINDEKDYSGTPFLEELKNFEILDPRLPDFWSLKILSSGTYSIGPGEILGEFWDHFYENDPNAIKTMQIIIKKTEAFHQKNKFEA